MEDYYKILQTPCFVLNEQELADSISGFQQALNNKFSNAIVGYSVKTNSLPYAMSVALRCGAYAEVVSYNEYYLALHLGFPKNQIIYNGPLKSKETFLDAIQNGAIVNVECWREIGWLSELPNNQVFKIGIRLNVDISSIAPEDESHEGDDSRFGFADVSAHSRCDFESALQRIAQLPNIHVAGLHTHRTSRTRSMNFYRRMIEYAISVIEKYQLNLDYIDFGGGYFGRMPGKPTYEDYAETFRDALGNKYGNLQVIVEPGNALVASAFEYVSEVIDVKQHNDSYYVTTNGTRNDIDPFFHKDSYFVEPLYAAEKGDTATQKQVITGCTCLEYDRLFTLNEEKRLMVEGDRLIYHRVGAYTMCLTPLFIHYFPVIYLKDLSGNLSVIRKEWTEKEYVQQSKF